MAAPGSVEATDVEAAKRTIETLIEAKNFSAALLRCEELELMVSTPRSHELHSTVCLASATQVLTSPQRRLPSIDRCKAPPKHCKMW